MTKPPTIEEIRALQWAGNHASDSDSFNAVDELLSSEAPMGDKREALQIMQRDGMGIEGEITDQDVLDYLEDGR